jgi:hypothetical protein
MLRDCRSVLYRRLPGSSPEEGVDAVVFAVIASAVASLRMARGYKGEVGASPR